MWQHKTLIIAGILLCEMLTMLWFEGLFTLNKQSYNNVVSAVRRFASDQSSDFHYTADIR